MGIIYTIHSMFGERILPILIVAAAIYLSVTWKPDAPKNPIARFFPILVDIQVTLGMLWFVFLLLQGDGARLLSFPLLLHPITGFVAAGVAHMAVAPKGPFARLGRWSALAGLIVLLVLVLINIVVARSV
jgi:hypothetical protein